MSMNAVALPILVGPMAMTVPSSEVSPPEASSFGTLVAAVAKGEGLSTQETGDGAAEPSAALPDATAGVENAPGAKPGMPPPFVVRQWLAQTDSPPVFSKGLISVLERFNGQTPNVIDPELGALPDSDTEEVLPADESEMLSRDIPALEFGAPALPPGNQKPIERNAHTANGPKGGDVLPKHDPTAHHVPPSVDLDFRLGAPSVDPPSIPHQSIGSNAWNPLSSEAANTDSIAPTVSEPVSLTRPAVSAIAHQPPEAVFDKRFDSISGLIGDISKHSPEDTTSAVRAAESDPPKATVGADHPRSPEQSSAAQSLTRTPEQPPQPVGQAQTNSSAHPLPASAPDLLTATPPTSNAPPADSIADAPVELALAVRKGQQTAEVQTLALHIAARSARGDSRFTIRLDPPELGRIDVNLTMNSHGHAQAVLAVEKPQTLDLLMRDAPALERALKDAGLELGGNLSFSLKEDGRPHFVRDEHNMRPSHTVQLAPTEAVNSRSAMNSSIVEHVYGLRLARLDITV